jgi:lysophospholipase L1-like esterase
LPGAFIDTFIGMHWYEDDVRQLEQRMVALPQATGRTAFYGSSSIRLWTTLDQDFPEQSMLNLGFGGSTLAACGWFMERILAPVRPKSVIFYAGDNDLGDGRHPEEVYLFFVAMLQKLQQHLPGVPLTFLSIKTSIARYKLANEIRYTNQLVQQKVARTPGCGYVDVASALLGPDQQPRRDCFQADGLHLSPTGYAIWREVLRQHPDIF